MTWLISCLIVIEPANVCNASLLLLNLCTEGLGKSMRMELLWKKNCNATTTNQEFLSKAGLPCRNSTEKRKSLNAEFKEIMKQ